jgi:hypothetical protein
MIACGTNAARAYSRPDCDLNRSRDRTLNAYRSVSSIHNISRTCLLKLATVRNANVRALASRKLAVNAEISYVMVKPDGTRISKNAQ